MRQFRLAAATRRAARWLVRRGVGPAALALSAISAGAISAGATEPKTLLAGTAPLTVVAFGTSLTARGGWQDALAADLEACTGGPVEVKTVARSGASSRWALTAVPDVLALKPDVVLVEFAANDAAFDRLMPLAWSEANLREIVRQLRTGAPSARLALMAMNPVIGLRGAIRPFLDDYYDLNRTVALDEGLIFVDHRPGWNALAPEVLAAALPDGSHPDPDVAARIIVPNVRQALFADCAPRTPRPGAATP